MTRVNPIHGVCSKVFVGKKLKLSSKIKGWVNCGLEPLNLHIETRTAERVEIIRLLDLEKNGQFDRAIVPVLSQFTNCDPMPMLGAIQKFRDRTRRFSHARSDGGYSYANDYFSSPDAEVSYAVVQQARPKCLIEVGSGNSTQLFREAIEDGKLSTELISIDPSPRKDIEAIAHRLIKRPVEKLPESYICEALNCDDILFIDSSHKVCVGNDVVNLISNIVPGLRKGVLVHFHDIFLPYEYPRQWLIDNRWEWNEQYLVQALLQGSSQFDVLWPGHYLQRTFAQFSTFFDFSPPGIAMSLWLRKIS